MLVEELPLFISRLARDEPAVARGKGPPPLGRLVASRVRTREDRPAQVAPIQPKELPTWSNDVHSPSMCDRRTLLRFHRATSLEGAHKCRVRAYLSLTEAKTWVKKFSRVQRSEIFF